MTAYDSKVKNLIQHLQDSHNGYQECANDVADAHLKTIFTDLSRARSEMIQELKTSFVSYQGELPDDGSLMGSAHQYFVKLKSLLTGGNAESIGAEIKRGENVAIEAYEELLKESITASERLTLQQQLARFKQDLAVVEEACATAEA